MARPRSPSTDYPPSKRQKQDPECITEKTLFAKGLLASGKSLHDGYKSATPWKHVVIDQLFDGDLLEKVKDECLTHLSFTQKETDIYKVLQTGDLASLGFLESSQLQLLPSLLKLRNALYSLPFRNFLREVTGCGPLSAIKQDMSVNSYANTCHLLNHDDVIGSRRVSYILYMPLPLDEQWRPEWGGSLELYPAKINADGTSEPEPIPSKIIPPSWGQFVMFEVQPGRSFHSVEEVVVDKGESGRQRLSISGWFHKAQLGEDGYEEEDEVMKQEKSSLQQLMTTTSPLQPYPGGPPLEDAPLTKEQVEFLSAYLNPVYLELKTLKALSARFVNESSLEMHAFLAAPLATALCEGLRQRDHTDGLGESRDKLVPSHQDGVDEQWKVQGPPHKSRYCVLGPATSDPPSHDCDKLVRDLQDVLFPSSAFRAWLTLVSSLVPIRYSVEARRFRPGLDYTLAMSEEEGSRLDAVLGLTPTAEKQDTSEWENGDWGGWECYMAPHDEEEDPAVYRSGKAKTNTDNDNEEQQEEEEEETGTLLTAQPGFNRLLLVLRDEGVMHFVKYVSASARGSRWDVCSEFEVGIVAEDDE